MEIHKYATETAKEFNKVFDICERKFLLGLSGTIEKEHELFLLSRGIPIIDEVSEQECRENGWIAESIEFNFGIKLLNEELEEYKRWNELYWAAISKFGGEEYVAIPIVTQCNRDRNYREQYAYKMGWNGNQEDHWSPKNIVKYGAWWSNAIQKRKQILYNSNTKLLITKEIIQTFPFKFICFSESVDFANKLAQELPNILLPYHSYIESETREVEKITKYKNKPDKVEIKIEKIGKDKVKKETIQKLLNNEIRGISTAKALDLGADIPGLQLGIVTSGTSTRSQNNQRKMRSGRKEGDKISYVINVYAKDTIEERWLKKRQKGITSKTIWVTSIEQIQQWIKID